MKDEGRDILHAAVALPERQRIRLIHGLLASLTNPDEFWEQQLADELNRRHKEVMEGTADPISWEELKKQLKR